jgi:cytoskeletal protein CcmA (bactofilin family)
MPGVNMWKRDELVRPTSVESDSGLTLNSELRRHGERSTVNIGKSVVVKGKVTGGEDLTIEGYVDGHIELRGNVLTVGPNGRIKAPVFAKVVIILGEINGDVTASERIDIRDGGSVNGDLVSPRVAIADGAHFRGTVDMQKTTGHASEASPKSARPGDASQVNSLPRVAAAVR